MLIEQAGCAAHRQPSSPLTTNHTLLAAGQEDPEPEVRADIAVNGRLEETCCLLDISVIHTPSPSYILNGRTGKHADHREQQKRLKYRKYKTELPLVPFVLESHGGWGKAAQDFLHQLSLEAAEGGDEEQALAYYVRSMRACSFALQRGNAHVMGTGVMQTRARRV